MYYLTYLFYSWSSPVSSTLDLIQFLLSYHSKLESIFVKNFLIFCFPLVFFLSFNILEIVFSGFFSCFLNLDLLLHFKPFFFLCNSLLFVELTFRYFSVPEFLNYSSFIILHIFNVRWNFIKEHCSIRLITISKVLFFVFMLELLEFEICNSTCCEV